MKSLHVARQRAQQCRQTLGASPEGLLARVEAYLFETHNIELHAVNAIFLDGGRAEVSPAEGCLFYAEALDHDTAEKLVVVLHELGHLELHSRLQRCCATPDPVYGSIYLNDGTPALARYNRRAREEAEANAFAMEFLCPSRTVLQQWQCSAQQTTTDIAQHLGVPVAVVQAQLAEALYWLAVEEEPQRQVDRVQAVLYDASQRAAASYTGCPVLVHAGPGTGKTATLVRRIAYLLETMQAAPEQLLVLTFSNHAAEELRERIATQFGAGLASRLEVSTFHGFGVAFLHHHGQYLGLKDDIVILDEAGQQELVTRLLGTTPCARLFTLHNPEATVQAVIRHLGYLKDRLYSPAHLEAALAAWRPSTDEQQQYEATHELLAMYRAYEEAKLAQQCVDFADLIALPVRILDQAPDLRRAYRDKYAWVMVDEYQDVSRAVASLLRCLCGRRNPPWVVGDTRQAIYRFRGAAPENVTQFESDFPAAKVFHLGTNYRSCAEIVQTANQLASLMAASDQNGQHSVGPWVAGAPLKRLGRAPVHVAQAASDQAEYEGIAEQIETWLHRDVAPEDIAVLARRNIDVKAIVLALGKRGIQATTSGLVTPEGAAGDLAAVATLVDQPRASLPRLAFALGRERFTTPVINAVITRVLATLDVEDRFAVDGYDENGNALAAAMRHVCDCAEAERFTSDAFAMMCTFLFDSSAYLRQLLDQPNSARRALAVREIVTSLSRAAAYRFLHPDTDPQGSRKGFAQVFRASLCASAPSLIPPPTAAAMVRVMTCHAAKGLEFPCVIVAGQTLPPAASVYAWLPPALRPSVQDEIEQADALFFVAATRAQRALVVTYATSASDATRSRARQVTPLLSRWHTAHDINTRELQAQPSASQPIDMRALWGGAPRGPLAAHTLAPNGCPIRTYLEHYCGVRYPLSIRPLYPIFFDTLRRAMGCIVRQAHAQGASVDSTQARDLFWQIWSSREVADHPHHELYANLACHYVEQFASLYDPHPSARTHFELMVTDERTGFALRHNLLAHFEAQDGTTIAMTWRPESLARQARDQGLLWSALSPAQRVSFVILKQSAPHLQSYVYSAEDNTLYPYTWTANAKAADKEAARVAQQLNALQQRVFKTTVNQWQCDRCPVRVSCPYWMGALDDVACNPEPPINMHRAC